MDSDVTHFDELGFIPSNKLGSIDEYLVESEMKESLFEKFKAENHEIQIADCSKDMRMRFYEKFMTYPFPMIVTGKKDFAKVLSRYTLATGIAAKILPGGVRGTTIELSKDPQLSIPIGFGTRYLPTDEVIAHESVHAIRSQWNRMTVMGHYYEEVMAYFSDDNHEETRRVFLPFSVAVNIFDPLVSNVAIAGVMCAAAYAITRSDAILPAYITASALNIGVMTAGTLQKSIKTIRLMDRADDEGLNMDYLLLRTNPGEYSLKKKISEQIRQNQGLRWDIIRTRLGYARSG